MLRVNYPHQIRDSKGYELKPWEEVIGVLNELRAEEGKLTLFLSSSIIVKIPDKVLNEKVMKEALGRKVGVLRTDSCYRVRVFGTSDDRICEEADGTLHQVKKRHGC